MYQPSSPLGSQDARCAGLSWDNIFVPGGANGVALKLNSPKRYAQADSFGLHLTDRKRLSVSTALLINLSHWFRGKLGSHNAKPVLK